MPRATPKPASANPPLSVQTRREIIAAKRGMRPEPPEDNDWSLRRAPPDVEYDRRRTKIYSKGLLCKVKLWSSGNNRYPEHPLIGLQVVPLEQTVTNAPATHTGVWHISVAFKHPENARLERAFAKAYKEPKILRLWFNNIGENAVSKLHRRDPIASDPVVQALHQACRHYRDRDLHITF